jgi:CDP-4-dehydro-6-deoxyglucose reductase, E1
MKNKMKTRAGQRKATNGDIQVLYAQAVYGQEEIDAVRSVLEKHPLSLMCGPSVRAFEERVADLFGKRHALMVNSGSSANLLAVASLGLPQGSEVITPVLTFSTTVAPLLQHGFVPSFVDVKADTFVIDEENIAEMITSKTAAILVPNLIGNLPNWNALNAIAKQHGLHVIEDSADTIGHRYQGAPTSRLSDIATTSFYGSHLVTCAGFGGAICIDDDKMADRARLLRGWGRSSANMDESEDVNRRFTRALNGMVYDNKFIYEAVGYNLLPSELSAAFGLVQLDRLPQYIDQRIRNFKILRTFFKAYEEWFVLPHQQEHSRTAWLAFPLVVREEAPFSRTDLQVYFEKQQIQTRTIFSGNILRQPAFMNINRKECARGYPNADRIMRGGLLIGCHQGMTDDQFEHVFRSFKTFITRYAHKTHLFRGLAS